MLVKLLTALGADKRDARAFARGSKGLRTLLIVGMGALAALFGGYGIFLAA